MENQKVHEYTVENGPNGLPQARLGRVHNYQIITIDGQDYHYLDGKWVTNAGGPVDEKTVPDEAKQKAASVPFRPVRADTIEVMVNCEFCTFTGLSSEYAHHLATHVRERSAQAPALAIAPALDQPVDPAALDAPVRLRPEQLPPGNYVLDEEGFVVLNQDGSPKKKAGRPRSTAE